MGALENTKINSIKWTDEEHEKREVMRTLMFDSLSIEGFKELGIEPLDNETSEGPEDGVLYFTSYFDNGGGYLTWNIHVESGESTVWLALTNQDEQNTCKVSEGCKCNDGYKEEEYRELPHIVTFQEFKELFNLLNG